MPKGSSYGLPGRDSLQLGGESRSLRRLQELARGLTGHVLSSATIDQITAKPPAENGRVEETLAEAAKNFPVENSRFDEELADSPKKLEALS